MFTTIILAILFVLIARYFRPTSMTAVASSDAASKGRYFAAPGRMDARSETIGVGANTSGIISRIRVKEGDFVRRGEVLADISCIDIVADLSVAEAHVVEAQENRTRVLRGDREEERKMASERRENAEAIEKHAEKNLERFRALHEQSEVSTSALDTAQRDFDVARTNLRRSGGTRAQESGRAAPGGNQESRRRSSCCRERCERGTGSGITLFGCFPNGWQHTPDTFA